MVNFGILQTGRAELWHVRSLGSCSTSFGLNIWKYFGSHWYDICAEDDNWSAGKTGLSQTEGIKTHIHVLCTKYYNTSTIKKKQYIDMQIQWRFGLLKLHTSIGNVYTQLNVKSIEQKLHWFYLLQGQMLYIAETDLILFQCYPSVMNLDDLTK